MADSLEVLVWRGAAEGRFESYSVPTRAHQTVLDVVTYIQRRIEPTLAYRFACRVGMCGSCAMTVNGRARWTCRTHVAAVAKGDRLRIAPLRNMTVIKDLVVDMEIFFAKQAQAGGAFRPWPKAGPGFAAVRPHSAKRKLADEAIECIDCGICYASCDVVAWNPDYLGPAALNRAWTLHNDERDSGGAERLRAVAGDAGCHACHSHESCRERCPKHLNPTFSIAGLKRAAALAALKGEL